MQTWKGNKKFFLQSCKVYSVSKLSKHCSDLDWAGWEGLIFTSCLASLFHTRGENPSQTGLVVWSSLYAVLVSGRERNQSGQQGQGRGDLSWSTLLHSDHGVQVPLGLNPLPSCVTLEGHFASLSVMSLPAKQGYCCWPGGVVMNNWLDHVGKCM